MLEAIFDEEILTIDDDIEVLDIDSIEVIEDDPITEKILDEPIKIESIIDINEKSTIKENDKKEETIKDIIEEEKKDKILLIQLALIIAWAILTVIIYFFGYNLFESFINVK